MKHKIEEPEGCRVVSVETTDEMVVVKFEKEEPEFKENDIVTINNFLVAIVKSSDKIYGLKHKVYYDINRNFLYLNESNASNNARLATDSEKQLLFDKLKEKCLMFDGENIVRWRAENDESYYCSIYFNKVNRKKEGFNRIDDDLYETGNYFPTREMAESFKKQYIELLKNFHKNL